MHNGDGLEDEKLKLVHTYVNPSVSLFLSLSLSCLSLDGCIWVSCRQGPHLTLKKQQVGWGTRLGVMSPETHRWCLRPGCGSGSCERWAGSPGDYRHDDHNN